MKLSDAIDKIIEAAEDQQRDYLDEAEGLVEGCEDYNDSMRYAKEIEDALEVARSSLHDLPRIKRAAQELYAACCPVLDFLKSLEKYDMDVSNEYSDIAAAIETAKGANL